MLIIFEANSRPVAFCTQRRTTENAPLKIKKEIFVHFKYKMTIDMLIFYLVGAKLTFVDLVCSLGLISFA